MRTDLYPNIEPYNSGTFEPDDLHSIYYEECGNAEGIPVVFLHGGPGSGAAPVHRRFFDPAAYRIVILDQRGCGRSDPAGETENNTTQHLIEDLEQLRDLLGIDKWLVFGGSWGSTLALAYGQAHPDQCLGFVLRGIFLGSKREIDWFMHGMGRFFPEARQRFLEHLPASEHSDLLANYYRRLMDPDPSVHMPAGRVWRTYENDCSVLLPKEDVISPDDAQAHLNLARLEAHYFVHGNFLEPGQLIDNLGKINHLPCTVIQGRYDVICPPETADMLAQDWPDAEYKIIADAGHSATEPGITAALVGATERFKSLLNA